MSSEDSGALTTGQRLTRIEDRLDQIIGRMDKLAEEADVRALAARLDIIERDGSVHARRAESLLAGVEARVTSLETALAVGTALRANRRWLVGIGVGLAGWAALMVTIVTLILPHHP